MPSYEEVEAAGNKAFVPPQSSKLQAAPADLAKALGLSEETKNQEKTPPSDDLAANQKADEEAELVIQSREARIQEKSEELYRTEERLALKDPEYIKTLVASKDPLDRKLAGKILKRNAETFGASSLEEYEIVLTKQNISDPTEQKIAELDIKTKSLEQKQNDSAWSEWKKANSVGDDIAKVADEVRATYPQMSNGDVVALARGKMGLVQTSSQKGSSSVAVGASGAPETEDANLTSPLAKRLGLKQPDSTVKFAKEYLRTLNS
jgi:hypothetical protein